MGIGSASDEGVVGTSSDDGARVFERRRSPDVVRVIMPPFIPPLRGAHVHQKNGLSIKETQSFRRPTSADSLSLEMADQDS